MIVLKGPRPKCYDQALKSTSIKETRPATNQGAPESAQSAKRRLKTGVVWNKKIGEDTGIDFRLKYVLLKGGLGAHQSGPVCHLCRKPYRSDLMYICCDTCARKHSLLID